MRLYFRSICIYCTAASLLFGCAAGKRSAKATPQAESVIDQALRDASESISRDLALLAGTSTVRSSFLNGSGALYTSMSLSWDGPIRGALAEIASRIGFKLLVEGEPVTPTIVHLKMKDRPALYILRDIGMQTAVKESLYVDEDMKLIRLTYEGK